VAFDGDGNLFIASVVQLRKVTPAGLITTVWDSYAGATAPKRAMQKPNASLHAASFVSVPAFLLLLISITCSRRERRTRLNGRRID
jgi:hypothetical protein